MSLPSTSDPPCAESSTVDASLHCTRVPRQKLDLARTNRLLRSVGSSTRSLRWSRCVASASSPTRPPGRRFRSGRPQPRSSSRRAPHACSRHSRLFESSSPASTGRREADRDPRPPATLSQLDQASALAGHGSGLGRRRPYDVRKARSLTECLDSRTKPQSARTRSACSNAPISTRVPGPAPPEGCWSRAPAPGGCPWRKAAYPKLCFISSTAASRAPHATFQNVCAGEAAAPRSLHQRFLSWSGALFWCVRNP